MEFAYLDESGDLGKKGSKNLVLTLMCTSRKKDVTHIIRNTKKRILDHNKSARWFNRMGEIKFYSFPDKSLLKTTLKKLSKININVYFMIFKKDGIEIKKELKFTILSNLFKHIFEVSNKNKPEKIIADLDFFNKEKINRFILQNYSIKHIKSKDKDGKEIDKEEGEMTFNIINEEDYKKNSKIKSNLIIEIEHRNSKHSEELQALDLISGCIFAECEHNNPEYINILKKGIIKINGIQLQRKK